MRALGSALGLVWQEVRGVQALFPVEGKSSADLAAAVAWATSLGPAEQQRLIRGEMKLSETDPKTQDHLLGLMAWEPDNSFAVLDQGGDAGVRLALEAAVEFTDPKTGARVRQTIGGQSFPVKAALKTAVAKPLVTPVGRPQPGALDFGEGEVLTLRELAERGQDAFAVRYLVDRRVAKNHYFVNGRMDRQAFEAALERVTAVPPVRPSLTRPLASEDLAKELFAGAPATDTAIDVTRLRDRFAFANSQGQEGVNGRFGATEQLPAADFLGGKTTTVAQLSEGRPGLTTFFAQKGLSPQTPVTLIATPVLVIACEGMHPMSNGSTSVNGQSTPAWMPNMAIITLR
jgi:hypothetical protein